MNNEADWRKYAKPNELIEHDMSIVSDRANAARRRIIRNRCRMRKLAKANPNAFEVRHG